MTKFIRKHWAIILILLVAIFVRFFQYQTRTITSTDQSRDAILALEAIRSQRIPLLGPPSSAWAFNFGPLYYYFVIFFTLLIPFNLGPWLGFTLLSVFTVFLYYKIGELVENKRLGIVMAFVAALSSGDIQNSSNMLNTALVSFAVVFAFFSIAKILKKGTPAYASVLGFSVALAINCHLQTLPLLVVIPLTVIFFKGKLKDRIRILLFSALGFLIAFIPLLIFESQHYFAWTKSLLDYAINGQKKFYTPVRWLTEITVFWPSIFGNIIFGVSQLGYALVGLVGITIISKLIKKEKINHFIIILLTTFTFEVLSVRYYKGPRSIEYFIFAIPLVILICSWSVYVITSFNKYLFGAIFLIWIALSLGGIRTVFSYTTRTTQVYEAYHFITSRYPNKISLKTFSYSDEGARFLYYLLMKNNRLSDKGTILVICDLRESMGKPVEYCPTKGRIFNQNRFVIYESTNPAKDFAGYEIQDISSDILFKRNYNNYELEKF